MPYASNNLATHVGDDLQTVALNRQQLQAQLGIAEPLWLSQIHGHKVVDVHSPQNIEADGSISSSPGAVCAVLTADCLPVLLYDKAGTEVAAIHCGWRGLAQGIIGQAVSRFNCSANAVSAYLGPAISARAYEVGEEVVSAFANFQTDKIATVNQQNPGHFFLDLYAVARLQLQALGVSAIYGGDHCCFSEEERFYSYRRDGQTGRMASLIWLQA
jgi:hypothetical protein